MRCRKLPVGCMVLSLVFLFSGNALAGPYADELSKCLVRSTSESDKNNLVKWMFAALASHPEVRSMITISQAQREQLNRNTASLFMRLLAESCKQQTEQALKYEGQSTLESSFNVLGQVAARGLMSHPDVAGYIAGLDKYLDNRKLKGLVSE